MYEPLPAMRAAEAKAATLNAAAKHSAPPLRAAARKAKGGSNFSARGLSLPTYLFDRASLKPRRRPAGHQAAQVQC